MFSMTTIGARVRARRTELKLSVPDLARRTGMAASTLYGLESGDQTATTAIGRLADALNTTVQYLETGRGRKDRSSSNVEEGPTLEGGGCPLISWVAAGAWQPTVDLLRPGEAEEWIPCPVKHSPQTYVLRVKGDSMTPEYPEGHLIFVDPMLTPNPGDDVIARLIDRDETTFKRFKIEDGRPYLRPINPAWPEQFIPVNEKTVIKGVVIFSGKKRR